MSVKTETIQGYCVKCKTKRNMKETNQAVMKNGKHAITGVCEVCGTKMIRIIATKK